MNAVPHVAKLPRLTVDASDAELAAHVQQFGRQARVPVQTVLERAYEDARASWGAPVAALDARFAEVRRVIGVARLDQAAMLANSPGDHALEVQIIRASLDALIWFSEFLARWDKLGDQARLEQAVVMNRAVTDARALALFNAAAPIPPPFVPPDFLAELHGKGVTVEATPSGDLHVRHSDRLTREQRGKLTAFKAGIVQSFGIIEVF